MRLFSFKAPSLPVSMKPVLALAILASDFAKATAEMASAVASSTGSSDPIPTDNASTGNNTGLIAGVVAASSLAAACCIYACVKKWRAIQSDPLEHLAAPFLGVQICCGNDPFRR